MTSMIGPVGVAVPSYTWGRGYRDIVRVASPPAGAPASHRIPSSAYEQIVTASVTLTTSAAVANRYPTLSLVNGDGVVFGTFPTTAAVAASGIITVTWAIGVNVPGGGGNAAPVVPLPDLILDPGYSIAIGAIGLDAADQLGQALLLVNHIPTGPTGPPNRTSAIATTAGLYGVGVEVDVSVGG